MKKTYEGLEMEVIRFSTEDIITTSEATTNNNEQVQTPTQQQTPTQDPTPTQGQEGTSGTYYYGPKDVRSMSHVLTPSPENDYIVGGEVYWPAYTDENSDIWFQTDGGYVLATNPDNFV